MLFASSFIFVSVLHPFQLRTIAPLLTILFSLPFKPHNFKVDPQINELTCRAEMSSGRWH